jgi:hypothetical protein
MLAHGLVSPPPIPAGTLEIREKCSWDGASNIQPLFMFDRQNRKAGGTGPPANHQEAKMREHRLFLPLIVVTIEVKVKIRIIIKKR